MNRRKLHKLIHTPKLYFIDGQKNRRKRLFKYLESHRPYFEENLHHVNKLVNIKLPFPSYYLMLHNIFKGMNYRAGADKAMRKTISLNPKSKYHYQHGLFLKSQNIWWQATEAFAKSIELSPKKNNFKAYCEYANSLEKMGRLSESSNAWNNASQHGKLTSDQYYRYGYVLYKNNDLQQSKNMYEKAISLDESKNSKELGIGIFHEKRGYWDAARDAYQVTTVEQSENAEVYYKLGLSNDRCYDWENAEKALRKAISLRVDKAYYYFRLGFVYERMEKWESAEEVYKQALDRQENFTPYWFYRLGYSLTKQDKYKEATDVLIEQRVNQEAHGVVETQYFKNKNLRNHIDYTEYYERLPIEDRTIIYESFHASSISCNPFAIFKELVKDRNFIKFKHVWVINNKEKIPEELIKIKNVIFIRRNCDAYRRYLAKAKYLINNVSFPEYFIKKEGQVYLNTWHGTPIKSLGKDIKDDFMAHKNVARNFLHATHLIQPNSYTSKILLDRYDVKDTITAKVLETGYPRQDLCLNATTEEKNDLINKLELTDSNKTVLYAPTWRGDHGSAKFDTKKLERDLNQLTAIDDIQLLFKGHHLIENLLGNINIEVTLVPSDVDTNSLLSVVDILITDYSSIAFDFLALKRPIIYYAYDLKEYEEERGLYFPLQKLGGRLCFTDEELIQAVKDALATDTVDLKQQAAQKRFCLHDDGKATKRVIDFVFYNKESKNPKFPETKKTTLLLYGGPFIPNGITTSFVNLLNHLDSDKYSISVAVDSSLLKTIPERLEQLNKVNHNVAIIGRGGPVLTTLEEKWCSEKFNLWNSFPSKEMFTIYQKNLAREYLRVFGQGRFDSIINFEGYNTFWAGLFSVTQNKTKSNAIYLHNDMHEEWRLRFPYLEKNFKLYSTYDKLVPVSEKTMENNIKNLSQIFNLDKGKFLYCDNVQNPEDILTRSLEPLENESDRHIFKNSKVFINIARLSPEKDQEKLILAFKEISKSYSNAKLINLGSGPFENHLRQLIEKQQLQDKVFLLGQRLNPYPYLKHSDCFILSSNHEGQPMTLFEALILDKPIIATDIVGNRSVLEGRPGQLIENSKDGLIVGMRAFLEAENQSEETFDYHDYNNQALSMFYKKVI